ncbi:reverse transcriptase domain, reverse transcriptase zinc-binding domain protein [Tanacetum coccineum]|uniref:Reverse transcriptase domain, reverse transcriptase zinc-binding domain protein n=1 Tax=Tanacetum coccineum TaxID=301880 RepID=A0ABQ5CK50_9ASTR
MHNNIMVAGLRDRPPMLAIGRYAQWRSRFLRYIDTRPNGDALRKCILKGPYTPTIVTTPVVPATEDSPAVPEQTTAKTGALDGGLDIHHNEKRFVGFNRGTNSLDAHVQRKYIYEGHVIAYRKTRQRSDIAPVVKRNGSTNSVLLNKNMVSWLSDFRSAKNLPLRC